MTEQTQRRVGYRVTGPDSAPAFAALTSGMARPESGVVELQGLEQPQAEAGLAFMTGEDLSGEVDKDTALAAVDFVIPAVSITQTDATCENAYYLTGGRPRNTGAIADLRTVGVVLEINGEIVGMGAGAAILNHPANAIVALVRHLAGQNQVLPAGSLVITGAIPPPAQLQAGNSLVVRYQDMGTISARFV